MPSTWPLDMPKQAEAEHLLRQMIRIRRFEQEAGRQYKRAMAGGFLHLGIGEEATIVGIAEGMGEDDYLFGSYRTHGHAIACGAPTDRAMAEIFGRTDGLVGGKGGSMHMYWGEGHFLGGYGIVGGQIPLAVGYALSQVRRGTGGATIVSFGDGASNSGNMSESLNMASMWDLPVIFLLQNNKYGMGTAATRHSATAEFWKRGEPFGIKGEKIDGMNVLRVRETVRAALEYCYQHRRPYLLECETYRFEGHSAADPEVYRERAEVEEWKKRDPIHIWSEEMKKEKLLTDEKKEEMENEANEEIMAAVRFAESSPRPKSDELFAHLYTPSPLTGGLPNG